MNKKLALLLAAGALVAGAHQTYAISGVIDIGAFGSSIVINKEANTVAFVDENPAPGNAIVNGATGDFAVLFGQFATYTDFTYSPLSVVNPLWNLHVAGLASFALQEVTHVDEAGLGLVLAGNGIIFFGGEQFAGNWSFSADQAQSGARFTFSSSTAAVETVPDGGATAMLLGAGVLGLAGLRRKLS